MITLQHIEIYKRYNADGDLFARCATPKEKDLMNYTLWALIDSLVQDLFLIEKSFVSISFCNSVNQKMQEHCDGDCTKQALKNIVLAN